MACYCLTILLLVFTFAFLLPHRSVSALEVDYGGNKLDVRMRWLDRAHIEVFVLRFISINNKNELSDVGRDLYARSLEALNAEVEKNRQGIFTTNDILKTPDKFGRPSPCGHANQEIEVTGLTAKTGQNQSFFPGNFVIAPSQNCKLIMDIKHAGGTLLEIEDQANRDIWFTASGSELKRVDTGETFKQEDPNNKLKYTGRSINSCVQTVEVNKASLDAKEALVNAKFKTCEDEGDINTIRIRGLKVDSNGNPIGTEPGDNEAGGVPTKSCESNNKNVVMGWILCGVINFIDDSLNNLATSVDGLLDVKKSDYDNANYKALWSYFKNIASFLLVAVALVVIIGQAISKE
jgi:hypothetical protein